MTDQLLLKFTLESDATFGRGDGVAGLIDEEVQHDSYGLPFLNGRTLKGLLLAECAEILFAVQQARPDQSERWQLAAQHLFGRHGSGTVEAALMRVSDARLPDDLRAAIAQDFRPLKEVGEDKREYAWEAKRLANLESLTTVRRQTAMDAETGAPQKETLRTMRVILRGTPFQGKLEFARLPTEDDLALLAACVKAFRRAGTGRNRGRGRLCAELFVVGNLSPVTAEYFARFEKAVKSW